MKVALVCVGKLKEEYWRDALAEYAKRLSRFCKFEVIEVAESKITGRAAGEIAQAIRQEGDRLLAALHGTVVVLDRGGVECTSEQIADKVRQCRSAGNDMCFVIGGSDGLSQAVLDKADWTIRFGRVTFPHQLIRVVCAEQIYRAFCINDHIAYHK